MATIETYKSLRIVKPEPLSGEGGQLLNDNFKTLADATETLQAGIDGLRESTVTFVIDSEGAIDTGTRGFKRTKGGTLASISIKSDVNTTTTVQVIKTTDSAFPTATVVGSVTLTDENDKTETTGLGSIAENELIGINILANDLATKLKIVVTYEVE